MKQGLSFPLELLEFPPSEEVSLDSARGGSGLHEAEAGSDRDSGGPEEALDKAVGVLSEATGRATGDKSLEAEGRALRTKGKMKTYLVRPCPCSLSPQKGKRPSISMGVWQH